MKRTIHRLLSIIAVLFTVITPVVGQTVKPPAGNGDAIRTWTSSDGKSLQATLVSADKINVVLRLKGGRTYKLPLSKLSEADRTFIADLRSKGLTIEVGRMPEETSIARQLRVEEVSPQVFTTEHFEFHSPGQKVSKKFISEAARIYEGTYEAMSKLPVGIQMRLPKGLNKFRGIFMDQYSFDTAVAELTRPEPSKTPRPPKPGDPPPGVRFPGDMRTVVLGVYSTKRKELLVPFSSLGVKMLGKTQITLSGSGNSSTLIHEIVHQLMHDYIPIVPIWFSEGFSEYMNATPYQRGRFEFKNIESGLKAHLGKKYQIRPGGAIRMTHPQIILEQWTNNWPSSMDSYRDSMLLFYYFMHLDRKDKSGAPIAAFFNIIDQDDFDMDEFMTEYKTAADKFIKLQDEYNRQVTIYNDVLGKFKQYVIEYNERVTRLNKEIDSGVPESNRTKLGAKPAPPTPPKKLDVPDILNSNRGSIPNFVLVVNEKARKALLRDRSYSDLAKSMESGFSEMGISIQFR